MIEVRKELAAITERLRASQIPSSHGVTIKPEGGTSRNYGNAVVGMRNPIAPPLDITWHEDGLVTTDFHLGAAYEGPPGLVHGGVSALLLDQVAGEAAAARHKAGMTGTLTLRYERPTPLGELHAEAKVNRVERSDEHTSEPLSPMHTTYADLCLKNKNNHVNNHMKTQTYIRN